MKVLKDVSINPYNWEGKTDVLAFGALTFLSIKHKIGYQMISSLNNFGKIPCLLLNSEKHKKNEWM